MLREVTLKMVSGSPAASSKLSLVPQGTLSSQIQVWYLVGTRILTTSFTAVEESGFCQWSGRLCAQNNMKVTVLDSCSLSRGPNAPTSTQYLLVGSTGSCLLMDSICVVGDSLVTLWSLLSLTGHWCRQRQILCCQLPPP